MKQSKTTLIIGVILAILSIITVSYQLNTNKSPENTEVVEVKDAKPIPVVQKSLFLVNKLISFR